MKLEKADMPPVTANSATITFDRTELEFLAAIMSRIAGRPEGPRGNANLLADVLRSLGYKSNSMVQSSRAQGEIYFVETA